MKRETQKDIVDDHIRLVCKKNEKMKTDMYTEMMHLYVHFLGQETYGIYKYRSPVLLA